MEDKIQYQKIALRTFVRVFAMVTIIFMLNSWPSIKQSFSGNMPPLVYWLNHSFKLSNILLIVGFGAYFYYKDYTDQKALMEKRKDWTE